MNETQTICPINLNLWEVDPNKDKDWISSYKIRKTSNSQRNKNNKF